MNGKVILVKYLFLGGVLGIEVKKKILSLGEQ